MCHNFTLYSRPVVLQSGSCVEHMFLFDDGMMETDCEPDDLATAVQTQTILAHRLDLEELKTLCFRLGINFDRLRGEGLEGKTRELVAFFQRRQQMPLLVQAIQQYRPDIRIEPANQSSGAGGASTPGKT